MGQKEQIIFLNFWKCAKRCAITNKKWAIFAFWS